MKYQLSFLLTMFVFLSINGQSKVEEQVKAIRKEFQKINLELESYTKKESIEEVFDYPDELRL